MLRIDVDDGDGDGLDLTSCQNNTILMIRSTLSNNLNLSRCSSNLNLFATSSSSSIPNFIRRASTTSIPLDSQSSNSKSSTTTSPKPNSPYTIFDVQAKLKQRDRAATRIPVDSDGKLGDEQSRGEASRQTDYVRDLAAQNLSERLLDIKRNFPKVVELGSGAGYLKNHIDVKGVGIEELLMCDVSEKALNRDKHLDSNYPFNISRQVIQSEVLPFEENSLDCIISPNSLHWVNDLPGLLIQIKRALKPDGVFLASILGGETLFELRTSLQLAELEREGGISPRVSPMTDTRDIASLLSRAGFTLPTIDLDEIEVNYPSMFELMEDLRDMGESNAVINRRSGLRRDTMLSASAIYQGMHGNDDGTVPATFGIIYVIGWKPAPTQPKPLERGSGKHSLKDILGSEGDGTTQVEGGKGKGVGEK